MNEFSQFIAILGKGKKGARDLSQAQANQAMSLILNGQTEAVQLGAFLMLMRIKEETPAELAGFAQAARQKQLQPSRKVPVDLDWSSYAGKRRHLPWFLLATFLLAQNGIRVFMHGTAEGSEGRIYTAEVLQHLGYHFPADIDQANAQVVANNFAYLDLAHICPTLADIIGLRPLFGLRSPVHTLIRLLNPLAASHSLQGVFHPAYRQTHQQAALLLGDQNIAVFKGEGGETERNPDGDCLVEMVTNGAPSSELWPAQFAKRHLKPASKHPQQLRQLWQGNTEDEFATASVIGTAAIALMLLNKASNQQDAHDLALHFWQNRAAAMPFNN